MPVFAALLKLLYLGSGRRYGEHLLFALHTNAFAFLVLSLLLVLPDWIPLVGFGLGVWLVFYLPTAMRKVYGGGRLLTALRWIVLMSLHLFCIGRRDYCSRRHWPWSPDLAVPGPPHLYCEFVQYLMRGRVAAAGIIG